MTTTANPTGPLSIPPGGSPRLDIAQVSEALLGKWADARLEARELGAGEEPLEHRERRRRAQRQTAGPGDPAGGRMTGRPSAPAA